MGQGQAEAIEEEGCLILIGADDTADAQFAAGLIGQRQDHISAVPCGRHYTQFSPSHAQFTKYFRTPTASEIFLRPPSAEVGLALQHPLADMAG